MNTSLIVFQCHVELQSVFNNKNNYSLLSFAQERRTLLRLLMTSNNSQSIVKERGCITIIESRLSYINITSFICIQTLI